MVVYTQRGVTLLPLCREGGATLGDLPLKVASQGLGGQARLRQLAAVSVGKTLAVSSLTEGAWEGADCPRC